MPNAAVLEQKQKQVAEISAKLEKAIVGVVVDYKGNRVNVGSGFSDEERDK